MFEGKDFHHGFDEPAWQGGSVELDVRIVDQDSQHPEQVVVDTAVVLAPDERGTESVPVADEGSKKPPVDPPETTFASPADFPKDEGGREEHTATLGVAGQEISTSADTEELYTDLHPNLELVRGEDYDLVINRGHADQTLVDQALTKLADGSAWHESEQTQVEERVYHVDDPEAPSLFAKTTLCASDEYRDLDDSVNEMVISQDVKAVIDSEQAQQVAREQGFDGIDFVEPLAMAISEDTQTVVTVYPWQHGQLTPLVDDRELEVPEFLASDELDRVNAVAAGLRELFGANGIVAPDLGANQILIEDNRLTLLDVEAYRRFNTPEAAMAPAETAHFKGGQWHAGDDPEYRDSENLPETVIVGPEGVAIGRGTDDSETCPEFHAEWQGDGMVVTLWNAVTKETAVVNVANSNDDWESTVSEVLARVPNASRPGAVLHVFGQQTWPAYRRIFDGMVVRNTISPGSSTDIYLNAATGNVEAYDQEGNQIYRYQPPSTRRMTDDA